MSGPQRDGLSWSRKIRRGISAWTADDEGAVSIQSRGSAPEPTIATVQTVTEALAIMAEGTRKRKFSGDSTQASKQPRSSHTGKLRVNQVIQALLDGPLAQHFEKDGDEVLCTSFGERCPVLVDGTANLDDVRNFCPLMDWQDIDSVLSVSGKEEEEEDDSQPSKRRDCSQEELEEALKYAKETKLFPPNIEVGSDFHLEFLYAHFCRNSPKSLVMKADKKAWKAVISKHLDVLDDSIGKMACGPYSFELVEGSKPVRQRSYPLSPVKKDALTKILDVLLKNDIIEVSTSAEWNSPLLLVSKGDGRWRLVVDYRRVNMLIQNEAVVYPRPDDLFETVQNAYFMFLIDGRDFYFQREIAEHLRPVTTFQTHIQTFQWKRMPQGLKPSSAAAINPVTELLKNCLHVWALLHCDDFLGWAQTEKQSLSRFDWVLGKFREFGMTLGWFKIWILLDRAEYVSHVIDRGRVYPSPDMVSAIDAIEAPTSMKLVQVFVGMCGYFALYVPMMAHFRAILTELTKDGTVWSDTIWTERHQEAFTMIKKLLKSACLYIIDWSLPVILVTDASGTALGGCLMQKDASGFYRPLRFLSRSLDKFERMQENREREMRAGLYCMIKCHSVLAHNVFTWVTDHANIKWIMVAKAEVQRVARLALWLSTYWYNLQHAAGDSALMKIADAMSRLNMSSSPDGAIFVPFEDDTVQHVLLNTVTEKVIPTAAKFSMTTDTEARLTRSTAEVVPNYMVTRGSAEDSLMVFESATEDDDRRSVTPTTAEQAGSAIFAIDIYPGAPTSTLALSDAEFVVSAIVEDEDFPAELALTAAEQAVSFSDLDLLTEAIEKRKVQLPFISLIQGNLSRASPASIVRLLVSLNQCQQGAEVDLAILSTISRKKMNKCKTYLSPIVAGLNYTMTEQSIASSRSGSPVCCNVFMCILSRSGPFRGPFPRVLADDSSPPVRAAMSSLSTLEASPLGTLSYLNVTRRQPPVQSAPRILATGKAGHIYSSDSSVPRVTNTLHSVIVNPTDGQHRNWRHRTLSQPETCAAYGLSSGVTSKLTKGSLSDQAFCHLFRQTIPYAPLLLIFQAAISFVRATGFVSKVGGVRGARTDSSAVVLYSMVSIRSNDSSFQGGELIMTENSTLHLDDQSVKSALASLSTGSPPVMFEFFSGTGVMAKTFERFGWRAVTIDIMFNPSLQSNPPTVQADVLALSEFDLKRMVEKFGEPSMLHFAPPCNPRSKQHRKGVHYRVDDGGTFVPVSARARMADAAVAKCFEIIDFFRITNPSIKFTLENPNYASFKQLPKIRDMIVTKSFHVLHLNDYDPDFTQKPSCWVHNLACWKARPVTNRPNSGSNAFGRLNYTQRITYPIELCQEVVESVVRELGGTRTVAATGGSASGNKGEAGTGTGSSIVAPVSKSKGKGKGKAKAAAEDHDSDSEEDGPESSQSSSKAEEATAEEVETDSDDDDVTVPQVDANEYYISREEISEVQESDPFLKMLKEIATKGTEIDDLEDDESDQKPVLQEQLRLLLHKLPGKTDQGNAQHMRVNTDGIVVYAMSDGQWPVPVINSLLGEKAIRYAHNALTAVHIGSRKVIHWIRQRYWWKQMATEIADHCKHCKTCQRMKFFSQPGAGFMQMRVYDRPGRSICIDIVVLKHRSEKGTEYLFTILDSFSHYPDAYGMSDSHAETCARCLLSWCQSNGLPEEVRSDGGLNLNLSEVFKSLYELMGIKKTVTHPYAPQGNRVERFHRWLGAALRTLYYDSNLDVDESLPFVLWIYRATENRMTGASPALLHMGREMRFPLDVFDSSVAHLTPHEYADHIKEVMQTVWRDARIAQAITQEQSAAAYNKRHGIMKDITVGSKVLVSKLPTNPGDVSTHILPRCVGPYKVLRINATGAFLKHVVTGKEIKRSLRQIRRLHERPDDDLDDEQGSTNFQPGMIVVVRLQVPKAAKRKWQVARLLYTTLDEDAWVIQWYNSHDTGDMLSMKYAPAWQLPDGTEKFTTKPKDGWLKIEHTVYKSRFITPSFKLQNQRLPPHIRALVKAHSVSKPPKKKK